MLIPLVIIVPVLLVDVLIPPIILLEIFIMTGDPVPASIPVNDGDVLIPLFTKVMLPFTDWLPIVFAVVFPTLIDPVTAEIPALIVEVDEEEILIF